MGSGSSSPSQVFNDEASILGQIQGFETLKDLTIVVKDEEFRVHRLVLAAHSSVFLKMFEDNPNAKELKLVDCSLASLKAILQFIYERKFPSDDEDMVGLFNAAGRFDIKKLKDYTEQKLGQKVGESNAFEILVISNQFNSPTLKAKSFAEIKKMLPGREIKEDWIDQPEKIKKLIEAKRKMDEKISRAKEEFESFNDCTQKEIDVDRISNGDDGGAKNVNDDKDKLPTEIKQ